MVPMNHELLGEGPSPVLCGKSRGAHVHVSARWCRGGAGVRWGVVGWCGGGGGGGEETTQARTRHQSRPWCQCSARPPRRPVVTKRCPTAPCRPRIILSPVTCRPSNVRLRDASAYYSPVVVAETSWHDATSARPCVAQRVEG